MLTPQAPFPARQGTAIRNWGLLRGLASVHSVDVLTFGTGEVAPELARACQSVTLVPAPGRSRLDRLAGLLRPLPDLAQRLHSAEYAARLRALVRRGGLDGVQIEGLELASYLPIVLAAGLPVLYDAHNAEYIIQARAAATDRSQLHRWPAATYSAVQAPRLRRFEADVCRAVSAVTCVSNEDRSALIALEPEVGPRPALDPIVVANGLDLGAYPAQPEPAGGAGLVFTGKLDYRPNVDACLWLLAEIWPRVHSACPHATLTLVGQAPPTAIRAWHGRQGVIVTGTVDDIRPHIARASVYVAPLRMGGGTRFKLLEAMALQRAIVSTPIGAEGFAVTHEHELLLASDGPAFAAACVRLLSEPALRQRLTQSAREFVSQYDWSHSVPRLLAVWGSVSEHHQTQAGLE